MKHKLHGTVTFNTHDSSVNICSLEYEVAFKKAKMKCIKKYNS